MVPTEAGTICIDGYDINSVKLERLRDAVSVVPQDPAIFKVRCLWFCWSGKFC